MDYTRDEFLKYITPPGNEIGWRIIWDAVHHLLVDSAIQREINNVVELWGSSVIDGHQFDSRSPFKLTDPDLANVVRLAQGRVDLAEGRRIHRSTLAKLAGCAKRTVNRACHSGALKCESEPPRRVFAQSAIDWMKSREFDWIPEKVEGVK